MTRDPTEEALAALVRGIRDDVATAVRDLILESPSGGSREQVALRLQACLMAERTDRTLLRPATMDLSVAAAIWTVSLDIRAARYGLERKGMGHALG